jgi:hypothetical protein
LETCWGEAPRQRCQAHFLNNLADPALVYDDELRKWMHQDLGGLPKPSEDPLFSRGLPLMINTFFRITTP